MKTLTNSGFYRKPHQNSPPPPLHPPTRLTETQKELWYSIHPLKKPPNILKSNTLQNHLRVTEESTESQAASFMPQQAIRRGLLEGFSQLVSVFIKASQNLNFYVLHNKAAKLSLMACQVNTLVYLCRLSGDTDHSDRYRHTLYSCMRGEEARSKYNDVREYSMIYTGPGFLAVVRFGSSPLPLQSTSCHLSSVLLCVATVELIDGRGGYAP